MLYLIGRLISITYAALCKRGNIVKFIICIKAGWPCLEIKLNQNQN